MGHGIGYDAKRSSFGRGEIIIRTEDGTLAGGTEWRTDGCVAAW